MWKLSAAALALAATAGASNNHVLHEERSIELPGWLKGSRLENNAVVPVRIGLKQNNLEHGPDRLMAISSPDSEHYGKHMSSEEVHDFFAPSKETVESVRAWLIESGVSEHLITHSDNKGWFALDIPAEDAERLFATELFEYEHAQTGKIRIGTTRYSVPSHIREHINYVTPGVKFSAPLKKYSMKRSEETGQWGNPHGHGPQHGQWGGWGKGHHRGGHKPTWFPAEPWQPWHGKPPGTGELPEELKGCSVNVTPACVRALYDIPPGKHASPENTMGLYEQGDYYAGEDVDLFYKNFAPWVPQGTRPTLHGVDGGIAPVAPGAATNGGESDLDIDIATALIYPQTITLYQVDDQIYGPAEVALDNTFNTFLDALDGSYCTYSAYGITGDSPKYDPVYPNPAPGGYKGQRQCGVYKPARVISASYGESEGDFPKNYVQRQCDEFLKLGLQGHTIFVSSSDYGVGNFPNDPDPNGCRSGFGQNSTIYNPDYPSGCPWITTVGATQIDVNKTVYDPESSMQANLYRPGRSEAFKFFASAGGFSNYFKAPWYQKGALARYFGAHDPGHPYYKVNDDASNIGENGGIYNRIGRGYPDISANGAKMVVYVNETLGHFYGTSLASPIWAALMTLINEERTAHGKGPAGFINPVLYENSWALKDITNGSNPNCGSSGFQAVDGWDPVTGLGTPSYPKLKELFLRLP